MTRLIPAKNALILWKKKKHQGDFDLKVVYTDKNANEKPEYRDFPYSSGRVHAKWKEMPKTQMIAECMRILFSEGVSNKEKIKKALFEFGKIEELEEIRMMYHAIYLSETMPYQGLLASVYGWDFCENDKS